MKHPLTTIAGAALIMVAACGENPVAPAATPNRVLGPAGGPSMNLSSGVLDFSADLDDLGARVLPALDDQTAAVRIRASLNMLSEHLAAGDHLAASTDIAALRAELKPEIGGAADIGNVEVVLNLIENAL